MNFSRKTILVVGAALLAACGDKVTVQEYTPPPTTAKVNFVEVTPATATVNTGASITFTAAVNADAGIATTVTWSASAGTVSTAGVFTAPATANPGISVCATSTVDTGKKGCATVVVSPPITQVPATVSIQSITGAGGLNIPVNPAAVAGQIDVTLNINPGNQTISKVELLLGSTVAYTQTFTAAQAAALRYAADEAIALQTTFPQVVASVATNCFEGMNATCNAYKATDVTGDAVWANGPTTLQAKVYTGTTQAASASVAQNITLANANAFYTTTAVGGTSNNQPNAAGFRYTRGDLTATIIPVSYNGIAAENLSVNFGTAACDGSATVQRTKTATKAGNTFTATFANSGAAGATNLSNYSFNSAACPAANGTGEFFSIVAATDAAGNAFTTTALPVNVGSGYRADNWAPTAPTMNFTIATVRNNLNWVDEQVPFNNLAANGGAISVASTDNVGGVGLSTTPTAVYQVTVGGNVIANASSLAESLTNATYSATAKAVDLLGNTSAASAAATFGVDKTDPTFTYGGAADATVIAAPTGVLAGGITYADASTLPAGPSTPSATPVRYTIQRRTTATASTLWNTVATGWNATGGAFSAGLAGVNVEPAVALVGGSNTEAYYVLTIFVEDGAANPSAPLTRTYLYDITAPTGPFSIPVATASAGVSNIFSSTAGDNLDVASTAWAFQYAQLGVAPGAAGATILLPSTAFGSFASFTTTAASAANYPLFRALANNAGGVPAWGTAGSLTNVSHIVTDRAPLTTTVTNPIPGANLPTIPAADPYATAGFAGTGFSVTNAAVNVDISGNGVAPTLNSVNITATAQGTVNVMPNPFTRVDFFVYDGVTNTYRLIGTATTPTVQDLQPIPGFRVYTWTVNWDPGTVGTYNNPAAAGAQNIIAIGWNSTFDAVRTAVNANITTVP